MIGAEGQFMSMWHNFKLSYAWNFTRPSNKAVKERKKGRGREKERKRGKLRKEKRIEKKK